MRFHEAKMPMECEPLPTRRCISEDLTNINYALSEMERISSVMLSKIDGGGNSVEKAAKEPTCISELLELMKNRAEIIFNKLDQINSMI